ncbi:hypothetical protein BDZ89DRAFT_1046056 [Hymenopellis radicata]|nr:hypothetical protein BDZ89DRAFT_1046056 [Hymenopellis radicata]
MPEESQVLDQAQCRHQQLITFASPSRRWNSEIQHVKKGLKEPERRGIPDDFVYPFSSGGIRFGQCHEFQNRVVEFGALPTISGLVAHLVPVDELQRFMYVLKRLQWAMTASVTAEGHKVVRWSRDVHEEPVVLSVLVVPDTVGVSVKLVDEYADGAGCAGNKGIGR